MRDTPATDSKLQDTPAPGGSSHHRMVRRFREWVSREVDASDVAQWWVVGWERAICEHVDEMCRATGIIWTNKTKRRLHRLILNYAKRRYWKARRRLAVAHTEKETPNDKLSEPAKGDVQ